jgi:hypothetical protein
LPGSARYIEEAGSRRDIQAIEELQRSLFEILGEDSVVARFPGGLEL